VRHTRRCAISFSAGSFHGWSDRYDKTLKQFANYDELWQHDDRRRAPWPALLPVCRQNLVVANRISEKFNSGWIADLGASLVILAFTTTILMAVDIFSRA